MELSRRGEKTWHVLTPLWNASRRTYLSKVFIGLNCGLAIDACPIMTHHTNACTHTQMHQVPKHMHYCIITDFDLLNKRQKNMCTDRQDTGGRTSGKKKPKSTFVRQANFFPDMQT